MAGRRVSSVVALIVVTVAIEVVAADQRPFTIEDLYRVQVPSSVEVSPDGKLLVYSLQSRDFGRGKQNSDLYWIPTAGGEARRLTSSAEANETGPRWSPDGEQIAFVARRGKEEGLWLLPAKGGEARCLVTLSTGIGDLRWSPDGRHIAFTSTVYSECGDDDECNERLDRWRNEGPLQAHVAEDLLYRHWNAWYDGKVSHVFVVEVATGRVRDLTPGDREAPALALGDAELEFSPDGKELAFTRNPDPSDRLATSTNADLWVVPVDPGPDGRTLPARNLTASNLAWDADPKYSPDGKWIAFRRQLTPGYESDLWRLALLDRRTGEVHDLAPGFDNWVTDLAWLPDASGVVFQADVAGDTPLHRVSGTGGNPVLVPIQGVLDEFVISPDGRWAYGVHRAVGAPQEIWRYDLRGRESARRLTTHNAALEAEVDIRPAERHWVEAPGGAKIHTFVVKPHGFDPARKYPVIINVHGGPQSQWADSFRGDWQVYPGAGYVVVFPNPHGSTGYGQAFTAQISGDYNGAVMQDIAAVTDWISKQPWSDPDRIGAMGWSWGGYAMNWLLGTTTRYKAIASMMGIFDLASFYGATEELWYPEWDLAGTPWTSELYESQNPARNAADMRTPTLVVTGERDYRIPYTQGLSLFTCLRRNGVPAKLVVLPRAGHWPGWYEMALYYTAHMEWFHRWLGGEPPPWSTEDFVGNRVFDFESGQRRRQEDPR